MMMNTKLMIGKDIALAKGEKLQTYRNRINGEILYSTNKYGSKVIDGVEFLMVFPKPRTPKDRRVNLMKKDQLERVSVSY